MAKRKSAETQSAPLPQKRVIQTVTKSEEVPVVYINNVQIEVSNWDVRFRLGQILDANKDAITVKDVTLMYMSHSHAVAFAQALSTTLERLKPFMQRAGSEDSKIDKPH